VKAPERLKGKARDKWVELFDNFTPENPLDTDLACCYCEQAALYEQAFSELMAGQLNLAAGKNGVPYPNPLQGTMNKALAKMCSLNRLLTKKVSEPDVDDQFFER